MHLVPGTGRPRHRASHVAQLPYLRSRLKSLGWRRRAAQRCGGQLCTGSRNTLLLQESLLYEKTRTQSGTGVSVYAWKPHADGKPMPTLLTWRRGEKKHARAALRSYLQPSLARNEHQIYHSTALFCVRLQGGSTTNY